MTWNRRIKRGWWILFWGGLSACSEKKDLTPEETTAIPSGPAEFLLSSAAETREKVARAQGMDPSRDGWLSESLHELTNGRLKELGHRLEDGEDARGLLQADGPSIHHSVTPSSPETVYRENGLLVKRSSDSRPLQGSGLAATMAQLSQEVAGGAVRFKQYAISEVREGMKSLETSALVWLDFVSPDGRVLQNMKWAVSWDLTEEEPTITRVVVSDWEEVVVEGDTAIFRERTRDVLGGLEVFSKQVAHGANTWVSRLSGTSSRCLNGLAVGDLNGDGRDDVFCPRPAGLPNLVFVTQPDGGLDEKGREWGLDWLDDTVSALIVDFDNDGRQDLAIALADRLVFRRNAGGDRGFQTGPEFSQEDSSAMAAADVNGDGLLDLFLGNYEGSGQTGTVTKPDEIYNAASGGPNRFYLNEGGFRFRDATEEWGFDQGAHRMVLAASWEDFDNDGDPDLYLANDFGPNGLYRNDGEKFVEVAARLGAEDPSTGMSVSWGDVNRDGRFDAIVGNMFSAAGNRVTSQPRFRAELRQELDLDRVRYLARGNTFLVNRGSHFSEESGPSGVINTQWTWSMLLADFNNDSREDLLAANGFITGREADDL